MVTAPWYIYYSVKNNEPCIIQADQYDLYDYEDDLFLSHKNFSTKEEAELALDHLTLIVYPDRLLQFPSRRCVVADSKRSRTMVEASQELGRSVDELGRVLRASPPGRALERSAERVVELLAAGLEAVRRGR